MKEVTRKKLDMRNPRTPIQSKKWNYSLLFTIGSTMQVIIPAGAFPLDDNLFFLLHSVQGFSFVLFPALALVTRWWQWWWR